MIYRLLLISFIFLIFSCKEQKVSTIILENYIEEHKYEKAILELNKLIKQEPDNIDYYSLRYIAHYRLGMIKEEILDINKIIELNKDSKSIYAHNERAIAYLKIGEYKQALSDINYVIENKKDSIEINQAYIQKATILYASNELGKSKIFYKKALNNNINKDKEITSQALIGLANISTNTTESLELLNKAIKIDPENGLAFGARGVIHFDKKDTESAFKDFQKAKKYDSYNDPKVHNNIGQYYAIYTNNLDSAAYYFEKAIKLAPQSQNNDMIYTNLGIVKYRSGKHMEALKAFEKGEKINPENHILLYNYAKLLSNSKKYNKALIKINKAIKLTKSNSDYNKLKKRILSKQIY